MSIYGEEADKLLEQITSAFEKLDDIRKGAESSKDSRLLRAIDFSQRDLDTLMDLHMQLSSAAGTLDGPESSKERKPALEKFRPLEKQITEKIKQIEQNLQQLETSISPASKWKGKPSDTTAKDYVKQRAQTEPTSPQVTDQHNSVKSTRSATAGWRAVRRPTEDAKRFKDIDKMIQDKEKAIKKIEGFIKDVSENTTFSDDTKQKIIDGQHRSKSPISKDLEDLKAEKARLMEAKDPGQTVQRKLGGSER